MGYMFSRQARYLPLRSEDGRRDVLLEISDGGQTGRYWFTFELPDALRAETSAVPDDTKAAERKRHRYFDRSVEAVKQAKRLCTRFKETRYEAWKEISRTDNFSLYKHKVLQNFIATCSVDGVYANELAYEFWNVDERSKLEWDTSIAKCTVLEEVSSSCSVIHMVTKSVWPIKPRDLVICTEMLRISARTYAVCNYSLEDYRSPLISNFSNACCRALSCVVFIVEEHVIDLNLPLGRNNTRCEMFYQADIDPGGWISPLIVNKFARREWEAVLTSLCLNTKKRINIEEAKAEEDNKEDNDLFFDSQEKDIINLEI